MALASRLRVVPGQGSVSGSSTKADENFTSVRTTYPTSVACGTESGDSGKAGFKVFSGGQLALPYGHCVYTSAAVREKAYTEGDEFWDGLGATTPTCKIMFLLMCLKHWKQSGIAT